LDSFIVFEVYPSRDLLLVDVVRDLLLADVVGLADVGLVDVGLVDFGNDDAAKTA